MKKSMRDLKAQAMRTLERLRSREKLTNEDYELLIPVTEILVEKLSAEDRVRFQHVFGSYIVRNTVMPECIGLQYIQYLLQRREVDCLHLTSGAPLPRDVVGPEGQEAELLALKIYDDDHMGNIKSNAADAEGVFNQYDPLMDHEYIRSVGHRIQKLRKSGNDSDELAHLEKLLAENTYNGYSKQFLNEKEKARQSVRKAIERAIRKLITNPDTQDIGLHLQDNIVFGHTCKYVGNWKWKF